MNECQRTKKALRDALQEMMQERPFEKVTVSQLCARCGIQRKSFYYHFKDKYDLLCWIFDEDMKSYHKGSDLPSTPTQRIEELRQLCHYFEDHRLFYVEAFKVQGQNAFKEHFKDVLLSFLKPRLQKHDDFELELMVEAAYMALERWLRTEPFMSSVEFVDRLIQFGSTTAPILEKDLASFMHE